MPFAVRNELKTAEALDDDEARRSCKARAWKALQAHTRSLRKEEVCKQMRRGVPLWKGSALKKIKCVIDGDQNKVWDPGGIVAAAVAHFEAKWQCDDLKVLDSLREMLVCHAGLAAEFDEHDARRAFFGGH